MGEFRRRMDQLKQHPSFRDSDLPLFAEFERVVIDAGKEFEAWIDREPSLEDGYILQAETEQRESLLKDSMRTWIEDGNDLIGKWFEGGDKQSKP